MKNRTMKPIDEMAEALADHRDQNGYTRKVYKAESDDHKAELLQMDISNRIAALQEADRREQIDFNDIHMVKRRAYEYLTACEQAAVFPSIMGLAVHGYGISRQALNQYLLRNPNTAAALFISRVKDTMADILTNAALYRNADPVSVIFQLKNHFDHSDKLQVEPVAQTNPLGELQDPEALRQRILGTVCLEDDDT